MKSDKSARREAALPRASVVWFTGLSGAGKSTIADRVAARLSAMGADFECLDGDQIRAIFPSTGFTREAREEHILRVGHLASLLEKHGVTVLVSLVSPYETARQAARRLCVNFVEVYVSTSLDECERRDVKGLYRQARAGAIRNFTGISDPYERPASPELEIDTAGLTVDEAADRVIDYLMTH